MKKFLRKLLGGMTILATLAGATTTAQAAVKTYQKVNDLSELSTTDKFIIVTEKPYGGALYAAMATNVTSTKAITGKEIQKSATLPEQLTLDSEALGLAVCTLEDNGDYKALKETTEGYYWGAASSSKTDMTVSKTLPTSDANKYQLTVTINNGTAVAKAAISSSRAFAFQKGTSFKNYATSGLTGADYSYPVFFKETEISGSIDVAVSSISENPSLYINSTMSFYDFVNVTPKSAESHLHFELAENEAADVIEIDNDNFTVKGLKEGSVRVNAFTTGNESYNASDKIELNFTVTAVPSNVTDELTASNTGIAGTSGYILKKFISDSSNVTYYVKGNNTDGIQINTSGNGNAKGSGIVSTSNPGKWIIEKITVTLKKASEKMKVSMSNTPNEKTGNDDATGSAVKVSVAEDAVEITGTADGTTYTYIPEDDYNYFAITSTAAINITKIEVYYKKAPEAPELPELMVDGSVLTNTTITGTDEATISFGEVPEGVEIWYALELKQAPNAIVSKVPAENDYTKYENAFTVDDNVSSIYYYAQKGDVKSEVKEIKVDIATGVAGIEAEAEGEAVFFNLQGARVAEPEHGIFIRVQGGKAVKVIK